MTEYSRKLRIEVMGHYGNECQCCGEKRMEFLAIDHVNGGGNKDRKNRRGSKIQTWLRANNYPEGFRLLCHNCNQSLGNYGYCPHQKERHEIADKIRLARQAR